MVHTIFLDVLVKNYFSLTNYFLQLETHRFFMVYYQCPDCGYKQRSKAQKRVKCHKCGRSYLKRKAKKTKTKASKEETEGHTGFKKYSKKD